MHGFGVDEYNEYLCTTDQNQMNEDSAKLRLGTMTVTGFEPSTFRPLVV